MAGKLFLEVDVLTRWGDLERSAVDVSGGATVDCNICMDSMKVGVRCCLCGNSVCPECYVKLMVHGSGVVKCPYCRGCTDRVLPDSLLVRLDDLFIAYLFDSDHAYAWLLIPPFFKCRLSSKHERDVLLIVYDPS